MTILEIREGLSKDFCFIVFKWKVNLGKEMVKAHVKLQSSLFAYLSF